MITSISAISPPHQDLKHHGKCHSNPPTLLILVGYTLFTTNLAGISIVAFFSVASDLTVTKCGTVDIISQEIGQKQGPGE